MEKLNTHLIAKTQGATPKENQVTEIRLTKF